MSTALTMPETVPSYLAALLASNPELAQINQDALSGSAKPMPPTIVADKGRFIKKQDGEETTITFPDSDANRAAGIVGLPVPQLQAVILKAKPGKEKAWYAAKYMPGQETQAPDCASDDGIKPNADARLKQCESCASCPQNVFGSGTDQSGNPTNGKACADRKVIAMFAAGSAYRFAIPPASLGAWDSYCRQLTTKGIPLPAALTVVGFEQGDASYKLTFSFGGMLAEQQVTKIVALLDTPEVKDIVSPRTSAPALAAPTVAPAPQIEAPAPAPAPAPAKPKVAAVKKAAAPAPAMDLGLGEEPAAAPAPTAAVPAGQPSDDDLINSLGL